MVDVAQLVRAPVCGTGGRGFKSRHPPHIKCLELLGIFSLISKHFFVSFRKNSKRGAVFRTDFSIFQMARQIA